MPSRKYFSENFDTLHHHLLLQRIRTIFFSEIVKNSIAKYKRYTVFINVLWTHITIKCIYACMYLQMTNITIGDFPGKVVLPKKLFKTRAKVWVCTCVCVCVCVWYSRVASPTTPPSRMHLSMTWDIFPTTTCSLLTNPPRGRCGLLGNPLPQRSEPPFLILIKLSPQELILSPLTWWPRPQGPLPQKKERC